MDLALSPTTPGLGVAELADLCSYAEDLGYRHAWLAEVAGPDAFVLSGAIAGRTEAMELGVAVVPAYTRTPAALAMAALSVSDLLGGRVFRLGIGSSSEVIVSQWHGTQLAKPVQRVRETVEATKAILNGVDEYQGTLLATRRFRPAVKGNGPIEVWVAGLRPKMLAVAGAVGDGVCLNLMPARVVPEQLAAVFEGARKEGRSLPTDFGVMARLPVLVTDDPDSAREWVRSTFLGPYLAQPVYNNFLRWMGYQEEAQAISTAWKAKDRGGVQAAISKSLVEELTLIGTASQVRSRLDEYGAAGITVAAISVVSVGRFAVEQTLRALAP
ncbi:MAG TPA: LLM class F420-dependent oxidoreductase [Acidimicrobiia bacterium]|nr:LLM class F420-dependent oxidoreductase [Acidimicrobiia bacterium]